MKRAIAISIAIANDWLPLLPIWESVEHFQVDCHRVRWSSDAPSARHHFPEWLWILIFWLFQSWLKLTCMCPKSPPESSSGRRPPRCRPGRASPPCRSPRGSPGTKILSSCLSSKLQIVQIVGLLLNIQCLCFRCMYKYSILLFIHCLLFPKYRDLI